MANNQIDIRKYIMDKYGIGAPVEADPELQALQSNAYQADVNTDIAAGMNTIAQGILGKQANNQGFQDQKATNGQLVRDYLIQKKLVADKSAQDMQVATAILNDQFRQDKLAQDAQDRADKLAADSAYRADKLASDKANAEQRKQDKDAVDFEQRDVNGLGLARTKQEAVTLRTNAATTNQVMDSVDRILAIKAEGAVMPFSERARAIETEQQFLVGALRLQLQGPGAMTDSDRRQLQDTIGDASSLFTVNSNTAAKLNTVKSRVRKNLEAAYKAHIVDYKGSNTPEPQKAASPFDNMSDDEIIAMHGKAVGAAPDRTQIASNKRGGY